MGARGLGRSPSRSRIHPWASRPGSPRGRPRRRRRRTALTSPVAGLHSAQASVEQRRRRAHPACRPSVRVPISVCNVRFGRSIRRDPARTTVSEVMVFGLHRDADHILVRDAMNLIRSRRNSAGKATEVGTRAARARVRRDGCSSARASRCRARRSGLPPDPNSTCVSTLVTTPVTTLGSYCCPGPPIGSRGRSTTTQGDASSDATSSRCPSRPSIPFLPEIPNLNFSLHRMVFDFALRQIAAWRGRTERHTRSSEPAPHELHDAALEPADVYRLFEPFRNT
jgi:hypothetical protein